MMASCLKGNLSETQKTSFEEDEKTKRSHSTYLSKQSFGIEEGKLEKTCKNPAKKESAKEDEIQLENKILKNVFAIEIPGVRITHCNFGRHEVQVLYAMEEAETSSQESVEKELRSVIEPHTEGGRYQVKLARKRGLPVFRHKSPEESAKDDEIQLENKILKNVFAIEIPGVRITHCNFGRHEVQVIYTMEEAETSSQESVEKELRSVIESYANGRYKMNLERKRGLPVFRHTSPGQRINVRDDASSIAAYATLTGRSSELFALVTGHGKREGDEAYSATDPPNVIGTVEVAREDTTQHVQVAGGIEWDLSCYYDVGLVRISDEEQTRLPFIGNVNVVNGVKLARVSASIPQSDLGNGDHVMLFAHGNKEGRIYSRQYNSINIKGVIGVVDKVLGTAIHQSGDSGTMVVSNNTYCEVPGGSVLTQAIGMLTGIEELGSPLETVSLAVPISRNVEILQNEVFHGDHKIEFA